MKARYSLTAPLEQLRDSRPWAFYLSLSLALTAISSSFLGLFGATTELVHFRDRAIGVATLAGVDASGYARTYVEMNALFAASFLGFFFLLAWADRGLERWLGSELLARRLPAVTRLAQLALAAGAVHLLLREAQMATARRLLYGLIVVVFAALAVEGTLRQRPPGPWRDTVLAVLGDRAWLQICLLLPFPALFAGWIFLARPMSFGAMPSPAWIFLLAAGAAAGVGLYSTALARLAGGLKVRGKNARAALAAAPLFLVPAAIPLANELQYALPERSPRQLAIAAIAVFALLAAVLFAAGRRFRPSTATLLSFFYFPAAVATAALFKVHKHTAELGTLDYFHTGEETLPTQQLFQFGSVPLLDLRLAHTFSDMFYQTLYTLANGFRGMDMLIWQKWMPEVLGAVVVYLVLARIASPTFAALAVAATPVLFVTSPYYAPALLPPLFLFHALRRPTWGRWALLWVSAVLLLLWRFDFGLVGVAALALVVAAYLVRGSARRLAAIGLPLAAVTAGVLAVLGILALSSERSFFAALSHLVRSYTFRLATRTRVEIVESYDWPVILQYYVLPSVALLGVLVFAVRRLRGRRVSPAAAMIAMIAAFSLMISVRSLERHSLIEGFNPYLFLFLLACLPFLLAGPAARKHRLEMGFLAALAASTVLALPPTSYGARHRLLSLVRHGTLFELRTWQEGERRIFFDDERHRPLLDFLERELAERETFFDFTNSPLLYLLAEREFPTWMIPNLAQTSEPIQAQVVRDLEQLLADGRLPFVVFKQGNEFWDATDGVANEVRCYRIAELVYERFRPLARIGGYEVWQEKERAAPSYDSEAFAPRVGSGYELFQVTQRDPQRPIFEAGGGDPHIVNFYRFDQVPLPRYEHWHLALEYRLSAPGLLQVFYAIDGEDFTEEASLWSQPTQSALASGERSYFPISTDPEARRLTGLRFDPPEGTEIEILDVELLGSPFDAVPLDPRRLTQSFDLGRLPLVWGAYDPLDAVAKTEVLEVLVEDEIALDEGEEHVLSLVGGHAGPAYLHLRLRSLRVTYEGRDAGEEPPRLTVSYGDASTSSFSFAVDVDPQDAYEGFVLEESGSSVAHDLTRLAVDGERVFEATGDDPYLHDFFDLREVPRGDEESELLLRLSYRATASGPLQIFYSFDGRNFDEDRSLVAGVVGDEEPRELFVPVLGGGPGSRLMDVRFDPPAGSLFAFDEVEIVRRELRPRDYLVRLSTQWRWMSEPVREITLTASGPVVIERAVLRRGD